MITLNRPKALNALNLPMIRKIYPELMVRIFELKKFIIILGRLDGKTSTRASIDQREREQGFLCRWRRTWFKNFDFSPIFSFLSCFKIL